MKKKIVLAQVPMQVRVVQRFKKMEFIRLLAVIYHELKFYFTFKKFDHGNEFKGYICKLPFEYAEFTSGGDVSVCCYLPKNIGNIDRAPFKKVWNSFFSKRLRKSMLDGSFCYCDKTKCRSMQNLDSNVIKKEDIRDQRLKEIINASRIDLDTELKTLSLANDYSCNLECPSCRVGKRKMGRDEVAHQISNFNSIIQAVGPKLDLIHIAGDGDPFASQFYDHIIYKTSWSDFPRLKIGFQTNGIALTEKKWNSLPTEVKSKVIYIGISIDGASAEIYEKLRLGGKFERLINNIEFLATMPDKKEIGISLNLNMIVQEQNYREIIPLILLGKKLGVDNVSFTYIRDWGTFQPGEYERQAIQMPEHTDHYKLLEILKDPILRDPAVDMGNLVHLMTESS